MAISFSVLMLVAVLTLALFLGPMNFFFWSIQREDRTPLWLAAWLTACALFALCRLLQYASLSESMYIVIPRILLTAGYSLAWFGYELSNTFIGFRPSRWERVLFILLVTIPITFLWMSDLILTDKIVMRKIMFGGEFHGVRTGFLYLPASLMIQVLGAVAPIRLIRAPDSHKRENLLMAIGYLFIIFFSLSDYIAISLNLAWIRLSDFNYLPMPIFFSYIQVQRFGRLYREMNVMVHERTAELSQTNEALRAEIVERRQMDKALEDNRKLAEELYELTPDALLTVSVDGKIDRINAQALAIFGYPREDLMNKPIEMLIPKRYHINHEKDREKYFENPHLRPMGKGLELFGVKRDGTEFPVEISLSPIHIGEENFVTAAVRDVTDRKYAEMALRESEERFRKIFNSSPIAICITTLEEGQLLDANSAYWDITEYRPETSIGHTAEELKMWDAPQEREEFVRELRQKQSISNPDDRFFHTDGSLKNVISFYELILIGDKECILAMFYDMSLQKQLEVERENLIQQLETQNAETETLRESFASIVGTLEFTEITQHILDQIKRVIPYDSASIWRVEGNLQKFISGRNLPPELLTGEMTFIVNETNSGFPILNGEVPYILNNNVQDELEDFQQPPHNYVNSWLAIPLKTRGKIIGLIALDGKEKNQFTKHHAQLAVTFANQVVVALENSQLFGELQNELSTREKLISELESKNAELERFFYTASHDLKSPIVTIRGFLGYLEADVKSGNIERLRRDIERINGAANKMYTLLNDLLELSRVGRLINPSEYIPFNEIVSEARLLSADRLSEEKISVKIDSDLPSVYGDRIRLVEVMQNLIENAANFMGDQPNPLIEIGAREKDDQWVFFVRDNGIGISSQYHERIFNLFDKLDPTSEGTGIGLAIVRRIIEVHGGRIWVESEAGKGSTFYFTLG